MSRLTGKDAWGMFEAYQAVYAPQEDVEKLDEDMRPIYGRGGAQRRTQTPKQIGVKGAVHNIPKGGTTVGPSDPSGRKLATGEYDRGKGSKAARRASALKNEELDIFDIVLEFLQAEGYAETLEEAQWLMANEIDAEIIDAILEEIEQLDEISLKTKMGAYARSQDPDADYQYGSKVHAQGERIKKAIVKKHGEKAGEHAERHADAQHWGRKDASGKSKGLPKQRIQKNRTYRTTKAGKMHGQDQSKLKRDLKYNRFVED